VGDIGRDRDLSAERRHLCVDGLVVPVGSVRVTYGVYIQVFLWGFINDKSTKVVQEI
jgi:hypothetical protein